MSEPTSPPGPPPQPPSEPPAQPPPGPPPPSGPTAGGTAGAGQPNTVMIVLAYLWILSLVPLLVEKEDAEVQWHAKHGLLLFAVDIAVIAVFFMISLVSGGLGCLLMPIQMLIHLVLFVLRIICIVQGVKGQRFQIPGLSPLVDSF